MAREQKTKSKASQSRSKPRVAPVAATLVPDTTQTTVDTVTSETQAADNITTTDTAAEQGGACPPSTVQQSATSNQQVVWTGLQPSWPSWPTSKPGPYSTPPAPGMRSINTFRSEQFEEVGYNQQAGEPATQSPPRLLPDEHTIGPTSFAQQTVQGALGKRKQRL